MSTWADTPHVPQWTLGWRIRRAIEHAEMTTDELARRLDVSRSTISRWCNDHGAAPKRLYLAAIADMCHVDPDWLRDGELPKNGPDGDGTTSDLGGSPSGRKGNDTGTVRELRPTARVQGPRAA